MQLKIVLLLSLVSSGYSIIIITTNQWLDLGHSINVSTLTDDTNQVLRWEISEVSDTFKCSAVASAHSWAKLFCLDGTSCIISSFEEYQYISISDDSQAPNPSIKCMTSMGRRPNVPPGFTFVSLKYGALFFNESDPKLNWTEARQRCLNMGSDLPSFPTITDPSEFNFLLDFIGYTGTDMWVGLLALTGLPFTWTTGENGPTEQGPMWYTANPNAFATQDRCVRLKSFSGNFLMDDSYCRYNKNYMCQVNP